jgi:hypothetical protein
MQRHHYTASGFLLLMLVCSAIASREFLSMREPDILYPSASLTKKGMLSDYCDGIKNTPGDTPLYYFDSGKPGATILLLGGTHPNESAGFIAATAIVENVHMKQGRLIVVPQACASGFTATDPLEACPTHFTIRTLRGNRTFRYGSRAGNPLHQWPDPLVYRHYPSEQQLSGIESRNLNRSYPGRENGSLMEQTGYAFVQLIKRENVDLAFDLHEAAPEVMIINAIIAHEKGNEIAATAVLNLEFEDLKYSLEISPKNFHGLSHREWGDATNVIPFLMETSNPIQGRLRGVTNEKLILDGQDPFYRTAAQLGNVRITYELDGEPLSLRVARHLQGFRRIVEAYNEAHPEKIVIVENIPDYQSVVKQCVGSFLR